MRPRRLRSRQDESCTYLEEAISSNAKETLGSNHGADNSAYNSSLCKCKARNFSVVQQIARRVISNVGKHTENFALSVRELVVCGAGTGDRKLLYTIKPCQVDNDTDCANQSTCFFLDRRAQLTTGFFLGSAEAAAPFLAGAPPLRRITSALAVSMPLFPIMARYTKIDFKRKRQIFEQRGQHLVMQTCSA